MILADRLCCVRWHSLHCRVYSWVRYSWLQDRGVSREVPLLFRVLQAEEHMAQMSCRQAEARQAALVHGALGDSQKNMRYANCADMLDTARAILESDAKLEPVRILGIPATYGLVQTLSAGAASALSAAAAAAKNMLN